MTNDAPFFDGQMGLSEYFLYNARCYLTTSSASSAESDEQTEDKQTEDKQTADEQTEDEQI